MRGDLADVDLARVGTLKGRVSSACPLSCGSATDLALNAFVALSDARGVAVATCCHHRCEWSSYVGRDYFRAKSAAPRRTFARIARWSSWACQVANGTTGEHAAPVCADDLRDYTSEQKREIGRRCKALLDAGRLDFLRRHGLAGSRAAYCDVELSPENWLLVAERRCVPCAEAPGFRWCASRRAARCCPGRWRRGSVVVWSSNMTRTTRRAQASRRIPRNARALGGMGAPPAIRLPMTSGAARGPRAGPRGAAAPASREAAAAAARRRPRKRRRAGPAAAAAAARR